MKQGRIVLIGAFVAAGILAATAAPTLDSRDGAIFPPARAREFLHQCSRGAPGPVNGVWLPQARQIKDLEEGLPSALAAAISNFPSAKERFRVYPRYLRQYAGFTIASRKIIYINASPAYERFPGDSAVRKGNWRSEPIIICDGGPLFFGAEYDPQSKTFTNFAFNGQA